MNYRASVLDHRRVASLAKDVARVAGQSRAPVTVNVPIRQVVTTQEWQTRTVTREVKGIFGSTRRKQEQERFRTPVTREVVHEEPTLGWVVGDERSTSITNRSGTKEECLTISTLYLLVDGTFAMVVKESSDIWYPDGRYECYDKSAPTFDHPASPDTVAAFLDFYERRLKRNVHDKGDGIRDALLSLAPESDRPRLRRQFPTLANEEARKPAYQGTLVRYFPDKGYGFLRSEEHGEVFLHSNQIPEEERHQLARGAVISFDVKAGPQGKSAHHARVAG